MIFCFSGSRESFFFCEWFVTSKFSNLRFAKNTSHTMSLASDILLAPLAKYFSTSEEKVFHVIKCLLAFLFLLLCDRILKAHEKSELEKRRKEKKEEKEFPKPQPKGDLTRKELKEFDGNDAKKPILLACKGTIFDVSSGRDFYGPGNIYFLLLCF